MFLAEPFYTKECGKHMRNTCAQGMDRVWIPHPKPVGQIGQKMDTPPGAKRRFFYFSGINGIIVGFTLDIIGLLPNLSPTLRNFMRTCMNAEFTRIIKRVQKLFVKKNYKCIRPLYGVVQYLQSSSS